MISSRKSPAAKTDNYLFSQLIPYLGNKRKLLSLIQEAIELTGVKSGIFVDLFAGSGVVSRLAKQHGFKVISNDWEPYSFEINNCYIGCNQAPKFQSLGGAEKIIDELNQIEPKRGWVASHLCPYDDSQPLTDTERMFFTRANGEKLDSIRDRIELWEKNGQITPQERSYLLAPLIFGASYVSNTSGVFKGFHRGWGGNTGTALYRILSDLEIRKPILCDSSQTCFSWQMDAQLAAKKLNDEFGKIDIAYIDPPYNQHPYGSNYHILNSIALWDKPELTPQISAKTKSAIRLDWRTERRSAYNYRQDATSAFSKLLETLQSRFILISYSTDGIINLKDLLEIAQTQGELKCVLKPYKRYRVSAQRMSQKPMNVEFVLIVDTKTKQFNQADEIYKQIITVENQALQDYES